MLTGLKYHLWDVNVYFTDQDIRQRGNLMKLSLEVIEMQN